MRFYWILRRLCRGLVYTDEGDMQRRLLVRLIQATLLCFLLMFLWLHQQLMGERHSSTGRGNTQWQVSAELASQRAADLLNKTLNFDIDGFLGLAQNASQRIAQIKAAIKEANYKQEILNEDKFGALPSNGLVIVVQVHNRTHYLKHLIKSFEEAKNISDSLIIFSHDVWSSDINTLVRSVKFTRVMQIFYPHSIQLHPHEFPGEDPRDCPRNINKEKAVQMKCTNALNPDKYGHYREARFTQTKHHWWWKINHVFDGLRITVNHTGLVLLLEEDHYVVEDFILVLNSMNQLRKSHCQNCNVLCLGTYPKHINFASENRRVAAELWLSNKHNMGMAFDKNTWNLIKTCAEKFCTYDDYNWDWSLGYVSKNCLPQPLRVLLVKVPHVFHIGECGVHHKGKDCTSDAVVHRVISTLTKNRQYLYPLEMFISSQSNRPPKSAEPNGGWADIRDHGLCQRHMKFRQTFKNIGNRN